MPVSVAPTESTTRMFGSSVISWSLIDCEKIAALEPIEMSDERSTSSWISSSESASGRAIASPVMPRTFTFSRSISRQTCSASNFGISTVVSPWIRPRIVETWPAPCISGAAGSDTPGPALAAARSCSASGWSTFSLLYASIPPHSA